MIRRESERSATVYTANWKETVNLKRTLTDIARGKRNTEHSIYMDQRRFYKRFQGMLHQSQLLLSRIKGDRDMERQLRSKTDSNFNTNCGSNEEEDSKLKRILSRPTTAGPYSVTPSRVAPSAMNGVSSAGPGLYRSKSVDELEDFEARIGPRVTFGQRHSGSLTSLPGTPMSNQSLTGQYLDTSRRAYDSDWGRRPQTIGGLPHQRPEGPGDRPGTVAALLEDDHGRRRKVISEINTYRIRSANFDRRVHKFCESVNDMDTKTDNAFDYYNIRLHELYKTNGPKKIISIPKTPESEYWRHVGDFRKRPITFKGVRRDFDAHGDGESLSTDSRPGTSAVSEVDSLETVS